jgi:hypothetical protein
LLSDGSPQLRSRCAKNLQCLLNLFSKVIRFNSLFQRDFVYVIKMSLQRTPPKSTLSISDSDLTVSGKEDHKNSKAIFRKRKVPDCDDGPSMREFRRELSATLSENRQEFMTTLEEYRIELKNTLSIFQSDMMTSIRELIGKQNETIEKLHENIDEMKSQITVVQQNNDVVLSEQNHIKSTTNKLENQNKIISSRVELFEREINEFKKSITALTDEMQLKEQIGRVNNIEISGVPVMNGENLHNILNTIAKRVGFSLTPTDIDYIHRVRRYTPHSEHTHLHPNIIARFTQRNRKNDLLASIRTRRGLSTADLGIDGPAKPVYVNHHLAPHNKQLYGRVRKIGKELNYKFIWVTDCKIFVRKSETSKVILISTEKDLEKIK